MNHQLPRLLSTMLAIVFACAASGSRIYAQQLQYPVGIAADKDGTLYIVDRNLPGVWLVSDEKRSIYVQAAKKLRTPLNVPRCAAIDKDGRLLVGCSPTRNVYRIDNDKTPVALTPGGAEGVGIPMGLAVNSAGDVFVSDLEQHCLWKLSKDGGKPEKFAEIAAPRGICIDAADQLWVVSGVQDPVWKIAPDGSKQAVVKGRPFQYPSDIAVGADGDIFVCDSFAKAIWRIAKDGQPQKWVAGDPLVHPVNLAWRGTTLLVVDPRANAVFEIDADAKVTKLEFQSAE